MKSKIVLFVFCLVLLLGCGKKGFNMGGIFECVVEILQFIIVNLKSFYLVIIKGKQDIEICLQVFGFIIKLNIDEGFMVKKGQVLFVIDLVQYEFVVCVVKVVVVIVKVNVFIQEIIVKNKCELNKKNIISDYDLEMVENIFVFVKV